jgi:hypothetical protein
MAASTLVRDALRGSVLVALLAAAMTVAVPARVPVAPASPLQAAERALREVPSLGLVWGRLRSWRRVGDGWLLAWQPSHGAWLLRVWVPDGPGPVRWRLRVAPWLPGVRLSEPAARSLLGRPRGEVGTAVERLARRDWQVGEERLVGSLPAGEDLPLPAEPQIGAWPAALGGAALVGALCLVVLPGLVASGWGWAVLAASAALGLAMPMMTPLAFDRFQVGVRPWVAQLAFVVAGAGICAAMAVFGMRFKALRASPRSFALGSALTLGVLAGRLEPTPLFADLAGLSVRPLAWVAGAVALGYVVWLAGVGVRELLEAVRWARPWLLLVALFLALATAGPWLGPAAAVIAAAAGQRSSAMWVGLAATLGWLVGATWAVCAWASPLHGALLVLLVACTAVAVLFLREVRRRGVPAEG